VLLLVASETGHVYTFATPKLQPLITKPEGKNLIQTCLNAPDPIPAGEEVCTNGNAPLRPTTTIFAAVLARHIAAVYGFVCWRFKF
jgi:MADS-box transcription factor/pheromone receptor transcription factor